MSMRISVLDRFENVAREVEASEAYPVLWEDGRFNFKAPIRVSHRPSGQGSSGHTLRIFEELSLKRKAGGCSVEISPSPATHAVLVPVPVNGKRVALGYLVVRADSRTAYFMLKLARLILQREGYFGDENPPSDS